MHDVCISIKNSLQLLLFMKRWQLGIRCFTLIPHFFQFSSLSWFESFCKGIISSMERIESIVSFRFLRDWFNFHNIVHPGDKRSSKRRLDSMERIEGVKISSVQFLTRVSRISISVSIELGNSLPSYRISPVHLSRVSLDRGLSLERRGPRNGLRTDSCLIDTVSKFRHWTYTRDAVVEPPRWRSMAPGREREREGGKKVNGAPPPEKLVCEKRSTLERKPRFQDNWHISKGEERKFSILGSITSDWPEISKAIDCLLSYVNEKRISRKKKRGEKNNIYSNYKQR